MLTENLFEQVLIDPARNQRANRLLIVSGFATAAMASMHMKSLRELELIDLKIELIVGMANSRSGIPIAQHNAFKKLAGDNRYDADFSCRYIVSGDPVHAKVYCWLKDSKPVTAFMGSANYSMLAFRDSEDDASKGQVEAMIEISDQCAEAKAFYSKVVKQTDNCLSETVEQYINFQLPVPLMSDLEDEKQSKTLTPSSKVSATEGLPQVKLSLLDSKSGDTPRTSGINWGKRPDRNQNQAYLNIPVDIRRSGFFPVRGQRFVVETDDGYIFIMARRQDEGKGLHTPDDNSELGWYLRKRMGVPNGEYVTREDLEGYGRSDIVFTKIDDETYHMDFSVD